jgi:hypothetical protein
VRLVDNISCENRISAFRLHFHPLEGNGVPLAELASHYYPVDRTCTLVHHLLTATLRKVLRAYCIAGWFVFTHQTISPRGYMSFWGRLDEPPGVSLLHGILARGDPELAVDGFDLGSYGTRGDVEMLRYLPNR